MKIDGVFCGGGIKGIAILGAIYELEMQGFEFDRVAGTSVGALLGSLIVSGYKSTEILKLLEEDPVILKLMDASDFYKTPKGFRKWIQLYWRLGLYKWDTIEEHLEKLLHEKGVKKFQDIEEGALRIVASDLSLGKLIVLPKEIDEYGLCPGELSIAQAVKMSSCVPFFFEPVKLRHEATGKESLIVDGGILSNFPMWLFEGEDYRRSKPTIGIQLTPPLGPESSVEINNALQLYSRLFQTMQQAHDLRYIKKRYMKDIIFIPVPKIKSTNFNISVEQKNELFEIGRKSAEKFLEKWSY